jgi:DNA gyrase subunit A
MFTHQGRVKRVRLSEYSNVRPSGLIIMRLGKDDELGWVSLTPSDEDLIVVTQQGQALRFGGKGVRTMGRTAAGINAIKLELGDRVCSAVAVHDPKADLLIVTTKGYGKRTPLKEFTTKRRYGKGVRCLGGKRETTGVIAAARVVRPDDEVTLISSGGMVLRIPATNISQMGRATRGAKVIELKKGDEVSSVAVVSAEPTSTRKKPSKKQQPPKAAEKKKAATKTAAKKKSTTKTAAKKKSTTKTAAKKKTATKRKGKKNVA